MKELQKKAIKMARETGRDPIDCFIEIANPKVVDEYSDEAYKELKDAGYSFQPVDDDLNLAAIREERKRLPILLNSRYVFTEANIVINDVKKFFTEVAKREFPKLYANLKKIEKENEEREKILKDCDPKIKDMFMFEDFTGEKVCWECGRTFRFSDIEVDNKNESASEQVVRKIEMWKDSYCGC